jgi:hypothetical protein
MANKITLDTITSSFASTSLFNTNFTAIKDELNNKVLYRDNPTGEANQMLNDLDMNSNDILNASSVNADVIVLNGTQITPTGTTSLPASGLTYDNTTSGLTATNVQAAIDEVEARVDTTETDITSIEAQQAQGQNFGKNLIINGDFSIWQRGTSATTFGYKADDRWVTAGNGNTVSISRQDFTLGQTDVPNNPKYFSRTVVTSSAGASNFTSKYQAIEGVVNTSGKEVTLSFWAKADSAKNITTEFFQSFGTGGSPSAAVLSIAPTTHALTTSWQRFTVTATIPSVAGKTLGTSGSDQLGVDFWFDAGSDFDARTNSLGQQSGTFDIANVQLEFGDTATEFEYVHPADQLARCQRYFQKSYAKDIDPGTVTTAGAEIATYGSTLSNAAPFHITFTTHLRSAGAITFYSYSTGASGKIHNSNAAADRTAIAGQSTEHGFNWGQNDTAAAANDFLYAQWTVDAEL